MEDKFKAYEKTIKKKTSFGWTPIYKESFTTSVSRELFVPLVIKTFETLGWELVYSNFDIAEARRKKQGTFESGGGEYISVSYNFGLVEVSSRSLGNEMIDFGRNSKRVKLFIYAFDEVKKSIDKESLQALKDDWDKAGVMADYEIPDSLPQPKKFREPSMLLPLFAGLLIAPALGLLVALASRKIYILGLYEVILAFLIYIVLQQAIKISNFTDTKRLGNLILAIALLVLCFSQYFEYRYLIKEFDYDLGFWEFIKLRVEAGLKFENLNLGSIGLLVSWGFRVWLMYIFANWMLLTYVVSYLINRVPGEVTDFATYHLVNDRSEQFVRDELAKKGWVNSKDQDMVFEAIGSRNDALEVRRAT